MARTRLDDEADGVTRPRSDVYVGMLALAAACMVVGIGLLAVEANDYDWESQPKAVQPAALPAPVPARTTG